LKENNEDFTTERNQQLYATYMENTAARQEIRRHTFTAQSLIADVLELMKATGGETDSYNKELSGYIDKLSGKYKDEQLQGMVKELVERTTKMRGSGETLSEKLEDSRREVEQLKENLERITDEANRDPLTGLANRKAFDTHINEMVVQAEGGGPSFCLLLMDIDFFKKFNDKFGHLVGDEVLKIVGRELMNSVKGRDVVARYGGEEFAVLLPDTELSGALIVAENLRKSIASRDLTRKDTRESYGAITVSIGAGRYHAGKGDTIKGLIKRADDALYRSKKGGRNRVTQETFKEDAA
ncbi:MAG: GGDEF domain-containing protein, partial [Rickettsiales bacterium]